MEARINIHIHQTRREEVQTLVHKHLSLDIESFEGMVNGNHLTIS
ncbi:hypothetical protein RV12_GL001818 [Enterococcus quebecensis]|nr:hypothetical protein RV12_GL001818 [Enterococcus quebecensis]